MANKKITDLQLVDEVTDGASFPMDDGIQSYRATGAKLKKYVMPMTTEGDLPYRAASDTDARLAIGPGGSSLVSRGGVPYYLSMAQQHLVPTFTKYLSGTGTHRITRYFFIDSGSAEAGATYTNNGATFTVVETVASGSVIKMTGTGAPSVSGTLTKDSGTGDSTLTFHFVRSPIYLGIRMVGGGGGGSGVGSGATGGGDGASSTFGTTLLVASGGAGAALGGTAGIGASSSLGTGPVGHALAGTNGDPTGANTSGSSGGSGGRGPFGGLGRGGYNVETGGAAPANTGGGGGGAAGGGASGGGGGASGGFVDAKIFSPLSSYAYAVGAGGSAGAAGAIAGGAGGSGMIEVMEHYQ